MLQLVLLVFLVELGAELPDDGAHLVRILLRELLNELHAVTTSGFLIRLFKVVLYVLLGIVLELFYIFFS